MDSFDIKALTTSQLFECFAQVLDELGHRGIVRTQNNPVGDYAEWLVAQRLGLSLQGNSAKAYWVTEAYQIPNGIIEKYATYRPHVNGHVLQLRGAVLHDPATVDITALLNGEDS